MGAGPKDSLTALLRVKPGSVLGETVTPPLHRFVAEKVPIESLCRTQCRPGKILKSIF